MSITSLLQRARDYRDSHGLTNAALARRAGLHINTLRRLDDQSWRPRLDTLEALERVIDERETA